MNTVTKEIYSKSKQSLFMTGCGFDSCCSTRKRGVVPMENCRFLHTNQHSRAVKGGALKMLCVCFVGSNPTAGIHPEQDVKLLIKLW